MAKVCLLFLLLAGLSLPGYTQMKTVVVIGSSTAAGYELPIDGNGNFQLNDQDANNDNDPPNSWVNRLRAYYANLGLLNQMINFAIVGKDINEAMPDGTTPPDGQFPPDSRDNITRALSVNPDIILVNFPSNNYDVLTEEDVMARIHTIYDAAVANGHTVCYICTTQPRASSDGWDDPDRRQRLKDLRDAIIHDFPNNSIDFYTPLVDNQAELSPGVPNPNYLGILPQYDIGGHVHINEDGHALLYNAVVAKAIIPLVNLPLKVGSLHVKRVDDTHITVTFTILDGNTEKEFFIWVKDKAGNTKSVKVIIPDASKTSQTITETIQIY